MWTNEENVVVKDINKNAQRFLLIKNVGKIKNVKKRIFYFKIKNVKNVFNIYADNCLMVTKWDNSQNGSVTSLVVHLVLLGSHLACTHTSRDAWHLILVCNLVWVMDIELWWLPSRFLFTPFKIISDIKFQLTTRLFELIPGIEWSNGEIGVLPWMFRFLALFTSGGDTFVITLSVCVNFRAIQETQWTKISSALHLFLCWKTVQIWFVSDNALGMHPEKTSHENDLVILFLLVGRWSHKLHKV